jgi:cytoskeleton protein RodZ
MEQDQPQGTARVGAGLREVRERLGWKLPDVADALRIRLPYLEAIEQGDLAALPGPAYQTGFVRSYAQVLGLDAEEILRRFRAEGGIGVAPKAQLSFLAPVPDRAVPTGAIVLVGVVLVLVCYGLWFRHSERERKLAEAVPSVPAELAPLAVPPKPPAPPVPVAAVPAKPAVTPANPAPAAVAPAPQGATATAPQTNAATAPQMAVTPAPATPPTPAPAAPVPTTAAPASPAPATPAPAAPATGQVITATADDWVEVRDATGTILFSRVLHAGESWPVPQEAGLTMTAGNAGGTVITVDGKAGAPLGAPGTVLRHYNLTPAGPGTPAPAAATAPAAPAPAAPK